MLSFINQIGPFGWLLTLIAVITVVLFIKFAVALFGPAAKTKVDIGLLTFFGALGLSVGAFSTLLGLYQGLQIFSQLSSTQIAAGFSQALLALLFGLFIFILASVLWLVLRLRLRKLQSLSV